jgi:hypothetical protein
VLIDDGAEAPSLHPQGLKPQYLPDCLRPD